MYILLSRPQSCRKTTVNTGSIVSCGRLLQNDIEGKTFNQNPLHSKAADQRNSERMRFCPQLPSGLAEREREN
jgi:hypothetical protein